MAATIDSHGEVEIICVSLSDLCANRRAKLVFRSWEGADPPYQIRVRSPSGKTILERVVRELPTGEPQSPPPIQFVVQAGRYEVSIQQITGSVGGRATLDVPKR
jgi:hypothetical protein